MKSNHLFTTCLFVIGLLSGTFMSVGLAQQSPLKVCPNPASPCKSKHRDWYPYDLSFTLPAKIKPKQALKFAEALARGEPDRMKIATTIMEDKVRELI